MSTDPLAKVRSWLDPSIPPPARLPGYYDHQRTRRYPLDRAISNLAAVVARAEALHGDATVPFLVSELYLFGSVLRASPTVGDLDLFAVVQRRSGVDLETVQAWLWRHGEGGPSVMGWRSMDEAALRRLRQRQAIIRFCVHDPRTYGWAHRQVWPDLGPVKPCDPALVARFAEPEPGV